MAWYIAIQDHHNPLSQHAIASYMTKSESQSFRLHSITEVAFGQRESCWLSQQSAVSVCVCVKVKGQGGGGGKLWHFLELVSRLLCCAYASYSTENKGFSRRKACSGSKLLDLLVQTLLFYACCFTERYWKSELTSFTEDPGCHRLSLCMSFACHTAAELGPCCQPCFTVTDLLLVPTPQMRYKRFLRQ